MTTAQVCMSVLRVDWEVNRRTILAYRATLFNLMSSDFNMAGF